MMVLGARAGAVDRNETDEIKQRTKTNARVRFMWFPGPWNSRNTLDDLWWKMRVVRGAASVLVSENLTATSQFGRDGPFCVPPTGEANKGLTFHQKHGS